MAGPPRRNMFLPAKVSTPSIDILWHFWRRRIWRSVDLFLAGKGGREGELSAGAASTHLTRFYHATAAADTAPEKAAPNVTLVLVRCSQAAIREMRVKSQGRLAFPPDEKPVALARGRGTLKIRGRIIA